jgi:hypothetical protein
MRGSIVPSWTVLVGLLLAGCQLGALAKSPTPPPGSWLILLCNASDVLDDPHPAPFYESLFSKSRKDAYFEYFDAQSNHTLDVSGSRAFGWFRMGVDSNTISARNNTTLVGREQTARDCRASAVVGLAAKGMSIDLSEFAGVVTVIHVAPGATVDSGDAGEHMVVLKTQLESEIGMAEHEMLHALGVAHHSMTMSVDSSTDHTWSHPGDRDYWDCWDMMSYATCVYGYATPLGNQGPVLQNAYRAVLGWVPNARVVRISASDQAKETIALAPTSDTSPTAGTQLLEIEVENRGYYVVEYHQQLGFDRGLAYSAVVIRELRNDGVTRLVTRQNGAIGWKKGDTFTDAANYISIYVDDVVAPIGPNGASPGSATVTVSQLYSSGAAAAGDVCGDKYHGVVRDCPAGTECRASVSNTRTDRLQSIDFYCL